VIHILACTECGAAPFMVRVYVYRTDFISIFYTKKKISVVSAFLLPACSFRGAQAATLLEFHVPLTNYFVRRWFCVVHDPKPPLHRHN
jgi:hypothetical protein